MVSSPGFNSPGTNLNRLMDTLGFPDKMGDLMGAQLDAAVGNNLGVARNLFDAFSGLSTGTIDKMMSGGFPGAGHVNRPHVGYGHHFGCFKHTHYEQEQIKTFNMGPFGLGGSGAVIDGKKIDIGKQNKNMTPAQLESKLMGDPALRGKVEAQLGGRIVWDGKADGNITVAKQVHHPLIPFHNHIHQHCGNMLGRCFQPPLLNNMLGNLAGFLNQAGFNQGFKAGFGAGALVGQGLQQLLGGGQAGQAGQAPGQAGQAGGQGGGNIPGSSPSDILKNPNMSFEQKLAMFMFAFMEKKQKELNEKMEAMDKKGQQGQGGQGQGGKGGKGGGGGGKGGGKGNPLGKIGNLAGGVLQMGGGLIGGMYGGPMGAAMGSQIGGAVGGALGGGGGAGAAGGGAGAAGGAGGKDGGSDSIEMKKLEQAMQEMNKIFTLVDNMLKSMNDVVKQGPLAAIRG